MAPTPASWWTSWSRPILAAVVALMAGAHVAAQAADAAPRMPGMEMHRVEEPVFNGRVAVYEAGRGKSRSILLVHGIGADGARDFSEQIAWLRESFHVVAVDLPGFGQSDKSDALYTPSNYAAVLKYVADRFLQRPFALVGHSMGALVSLRYAAVNPADVERLVVMSVPGVLHRHATTSRYLASFMGVSQSEFESLSWLARLPGKLLTPLERLGVDTRVQSAVQMDKVCEPFIQRRAERHIDKGRVVIFAAGTGNPFFTTDSGAALRAAEMKCDALFKGTSVDGVYDADPKKVPGAKRYDTLSYDRVLADNLKVMDAAAVALCRDSNIPIVVFNIREPGNLAAVLRSEGTATVVGNEAAYA